MRLSFKFHPKINHQKLEIIKELSWHTSKLYNTVNYQVKNNDDIVPIYTKLEKKFKSNWHNDFLHSHNRQHCLKQLTQDWKSFFASIKDFKKNPSKYKGQPRPPKFKKMNLNPNEIIYTSAAIRVRDNKLLLSLSKEIKSKYGVKSLNFVLPKGVQSYINLDNIQQVRIKQDRLSKEWYILIIYKAKEKSSKTGNNLMAIDPGLNNLATITLKDNLESYIVSGRSLKSKNSYFNKEITKLQAIRMKQVGSEKFKDTKNIRSLRLKRKNYIQDYLHKASRIIVDLAIDKEVSTIVIGDIKNIKQGSKIKSFVQVPIQRLIELIEYKAKLEGIQVKKVNESYTSGCSAVDLEKLNKSNYNKSRRVTRGLFQSKDLDINSDVNGSLNIMRKYLKDKCIPRLVKQARDNGFVNNPLRLRVS